MSAARPSGTGFAANWSARVLRTPPLIAPSRQFIYPRLVPGEEDALARGALLLDIHPAGAAPYLATCALGFQDPSLPSGVFACPRPDDLLALAGGYAYLLDTLDPARCLHLSLRPVTAVLPAVNEGVLLLAGFHQVCAIDESGLRWISERLSWEGLTLEEACAGTLHGRGWDMVSDRELAFSVDLRTGKHRGGGFHPR